MTSAHTLLFASSNAHKLHELRNLIPASFTLIGLDDIQWTTDIPEPFDTFEENAAAKALFVHERTGMTCFAEDSGLEVDALQGRPGVLSARYAGMHGNSVANMEKLLRELEGVTQRTARFVAVIAFKQENEDMIFFSGRVEGSIAKRISGTSGFGYDPVFIPAGFNQTFGELSPAIKLSISHRSKALNAFLEHLH